MKTEFHQLPGENLKAWQARLEAIEPAELNPHQRIIRFLCVADIETQLRPAGRATEGPRRADGRRQSALVEQVSRLWDEASGEERVQILLHIDQCRRGK